MGLLQEWQCDICGDKFKRDQAYVHLVGLNFTSNTTFKLGVYSATDGKHICRKCLKQIQEQKAP